MLYRSRDRSVYRSKQFVLIFQGKKLKPFHAALVRAGTSGVHQRCLRVYRQTGVQRALVSIMFSFGRWLGLEARRLWYH